jgi:hypothetical protein
VPLTPPSGALQSLAPSASLLVDSGRPFDAGSDRLDVSAIRVGGVFKASEANGKQLAVFRSWSVQDLARPVPGVVPRHLPAGGTHGGDALCVGGGGRARQGRARFGPLAGQGRRGAPPPPSTRSPDARSYSSGAAAGDRQAPVDSDVDRRMAGGGEFRQIAGSTAGADGRGGRKPLRRHWHEGCEPPKTFVPAPSTGHGRPENRAAGTGIDAS